MKYWAGQLHDQIIWRPARLPVTNVAEGEYDAGVSVDGGLRISSEGFELIS